MADFQIFTADEIASLRRGGKILRAALEHVAALVRPGISTGELDSAAEAFICSQGAEPAFKGYRGFPATFCISVNDETVHSIPGDRVLAEGDIVSLDGGVLLDGLYTDACVTVGVGTISPEARKLLQVTEQALADALEVVHEGAHVGDVSARIQQTVEKAGLYPVASLTGHGLGYKLHQFPDIPNFGKKGTGPVFPAGTIVAIEPIVAVGSPEIREKGDGWTICTEDGSLSAHFEHTILVLPEGCEILA